MSTFNNNKKEQSQLDPGGVLKSAHSDEARALRTVDVNSLAKDNYSHFSVTYDGNNNPTKIIYKLGTVAESYNITFTSDLSSSLNNTYFYINGGRDSKEFYVWYNVGGSGTDPAISGKTGIEVPIQANDPAMVVALATKMRVDSETDEIYFNVQRLSNDYTTYRFLAKAKGITSNASDAGSTGFSISKVEDGDEVILDTINIEYDNSQNPIWQGEVLYGYTYNIFNAKFEQESSSIGSNLQTTSPSSDQAIRVSNEGPYGNKYIPNIIDNLVGATTYDEVSTDITGNVETITFFSTNAPVYAVAITYTDDEWAIEEVSVLTNAILLESGDELLLESGDVLLQE